MIDKGGMSRDATDEMSMGCHLQRLYKNLATPMFGYNRLWGYDRGDPNRIRRQKMKRLMKIVMAMLGVALGRPI